MTKRQNTTTTSSYLSSLKQRLNDKRYWKKDRYSDEWILTEAGKRISFKIEEEKRRLKGQKENDPVYLASKIQKKCNELFRGLTQKDMLKSSSTSRTEILDDYIRPSRACYMRLAMVTRQVTE